jgi:hypothetical protein
MYTFSLILSFQADFLTATSIWDDDRPLLELMFIEVLPIVHNGAA